MPQARSDDDRQVKPFAAFLQETARGKTHTELSQALHDLVAKVIETGKKGTLTYVVTVQPLDKDGAAMTISDEIKLKLPEHDRGTHIAFVDKNGNLQRTNPDEPELPLVVVETPAKPLRRMNDDRPSNVDADGVING